MIRIHCNACHRPILVDETKLPMREVIFPCPACKAALTVDRRNAGQETTPAAVPPAAKAGPAPPPAPATPPVEEPGAILEDEIGRAHV